jgi:hypothetical protein
MLQSVRNGSTLLGLLVVLGTGIANVAGIGLMVQSYTSAASSAAVASATTPAKHMTTSQGLKG